MNRWFIAIGVVLASAAPSLAAEAEGPTSPLYSPEQGIVTSIVTIVVFIVLVVVLAKVAWGPILTGLKNREEKIRKEIADAEEARAKAEATLRDYSAQLATAEQKVRDMLNKAATDAEKLAAQIRTHAQHEAEETKERALKDIDSAREQAVAQVYEQAADLATKVAEKILRRELRPEDQRDLVDRSLEKVSGVSTN